MRTKKGLYTYQVYQGINQQQKPLQQRIIYVGPKYVIYSRTHRKRRKQRMESEKQQQQERKGAQLWALSALAGLRQEQLLYKYTYKSYVGRLVEEYYDRFYK